MICVLTLQHKEVARIFNILPERQAKVNYLLASQEKAEAAKVMLRPEPNLRRMPFFQRQNLHQAMWL